MSHPGSGHSEWWKSAVFYQIYPRSFADANGDGIGDFLGMTSKLNYLKDLGVDALWLSPHFPSANKDFGYDITNYEGVGAEYGTMADFDAFLARAHGLGLKVILDWVVNHTSDEHPWFLESKQSRDNPKADWYVWETEKPNNWQSLFEGDAWTWSPERSQYYYHFFLKEQPDLNWHNPEVQAAVWKAIRFWLDKGVDGLRLDAIGTVFEDPQRRDHRAGLTIAEVKRFNARVKTEEDRRQNDRNWRLMFEYQNSTKFGVHDLLKELRTLVAGYPGDRVLVGEEAHPSYYGNGHDELQLVFNFPLMFSVPLTPAKIRHNQRYRTRQLDRVSPDCWPCNTLGNHDVSRVASRSGNHPGVNRLNTLLLATLRGTPFFYNGEELGMVDHLFWGEGQLLDSPALWYAEVLETEHGLPRGEARRQAALSGRDKLRTPLPWDREGWTNPWLPHHPNHKDGLNVADQTGDPASMLEFTRQILALRRRYPALQVGQQEVLLPRSRTLLAFRRFTASESLLIVMNWSDKPRELTLSGHEFQLPAWGWSVTEEKP